MNNHLDYLFAMVLAGLALVIAVFCLLQRLVH